MRRRFFVRINELIGRDIKNNKTKYIIIVFLFIVGITAGTFTVSNFRETAKQELKDYVLLLLAALKSSEVRHFSILIFSWLQNTVLYLVMGAFSLLMAGIPVVAALILFKGFSL